MTSITGGPGGESVSALRAELTSAGVTIARLTAENAELRSPLTAVPAAWMRRMRSPSTPADPGEIYYDFSEGEDKPEGDGWVPLYRSTPAPAAELLERQRDTLVMLFAGTLNAISDSGGDVNLNLLPGGDTQLYGLISAKRVELSHGERQRRAAVAIKAPSPEPCSDAACSLPAGHAGEHNDDNVPF